jgi:hypothetical protein
VIQVQPVLRIESGRIGHLSVFGSKPYRIRTGDRIGTGLCSAVYAMVFDSEPYIDQRP